MKNSISFTVDELSNYVLVIEPWAEEFLMTPPSVYTLSVNSISSFDVEVNIEGNYIIFTAPPQSTCAVNKDGICISEGRMINPSP